MSVMQSVPNANVESVFWLPNNLTVEICKIGKYM